MTKPDIRWQQRFANYLRALHKLDEAIAMLNLKLSDRELVDALSELEQEGVIQRFEYTQELAWSVLKDYLEYQGTPSIVGSRDAVREAFRANLIDRGDVWMEMIQSRNDTSHTYNEQTADAVFLRIVRDYYPLFKSLEERMLRIRDGDLTGGESK
jgi:nucleotidyltransferase substrate binding protein (TIGR01987 family)